MNGTGVGGRITREDVEKHLAKAPAKAKQKRRQRLHQRLNRLWRAWRKTCSDDPPAKTRS
ncbi:hypothetical protein ACNKHK_03585 [Shigella flexneri]